MVWPLNRQPVPLPEDMDLWPTVDIFVPTYNEDLNVVKTPFTPRRVSTGRRTS
nr:Cellulose synthase catalytic subunit [UDP-forming] [Klebsiella pneumoniae]